MPDYSLADIAAATGNGGNNNGDGWNNGGGWWILLLFILLGGFNGNRNWGNQGGGYGAGGVGGNELYPWLNNAENINGGFRDQMIQTTLQGIQTQGQNLATQLCQCCGDMQMALANGFAGVQQSLCNGFNGVEQGANARQMANMQTQFGMQTAMMQGFNGVQAQLADCCCENRLATANQTATILAENCADRAALSDGVRDIIAAQTANTQRQIDNQNMWGQRLADQLCQYRLEDKDETIAQLRQQISMKDLAASQAAQNSFIQQGFANEVDQLYNRLNTCPVPSMPVYGRTPIFTCNGQNPCGCGCGA